MATTTLAKNAVDTLKSAANSAKLNTSNPFGFITKLSDIRGALDTATNAAYDQNMKEALLGLNKVEDTAYKNTQNSINELRNTLASGVANGASRGAANASAIQALLGLGQQNSELATQGLQNIHNLAGERAAALAQNAVTAIETSNAAKTQNATAATEKYVADQTRSAEALAALSALTGTTDTNEANISMNNSTNSTNKEIAKLNNTSNEKIADKTQNQKITYVNK